MQSLWSALRDAESYTDFARLVESPSVASLVRADFVPLAFEASKLGKLDILKWLLKSKNIPIQTVWGDEVQAPTSLLHLAVSRHDGDLARWLTDRSQQRVEDLIDVFCLEVEGETALELALRLDEFGSEIFFILLDVKFRSAWYMSEGPLVVLNKALQKAGDDQLAWYIKAQIRYQQITKIDSMFCVRSLSELKDAVSEYDWWDERDGRWSPEEADVLYQLVEEAARRGEVAKLEWLLDDWQISLYPPRHSFRFGSMTIADRIAIGKHYAHIKELQEHPDNDREESIMDMWSRRWFYWRVFNDGWDGKVESLLGESCDENMKHWIEWFEAKSKKSYRRNLAYEQLVEREVDDRLAILKVLCTRIERGGAFCFPRLDAVVAADELNVLRWMSFAGHVDLGGMIRERLVWSRQQEAGQEEEHAATEARNEATSSQGEQEEDQSGTEASNEATSRSWVSFGGLANFGQMIRERLVWSREQGDEQEQEQIVAEIGNEATPSQGDTTSTLLRAHQLAVDGVPDHLDEECAICLQEKVRPYQLECQHSFCKYCIEATLANPKEKVLLSHIQCPLCRQWSLLLPSLSAPLRLREDMRFSSPWLTPRGPDTNVTIAQILLGLAAGMGSLKVLGWLIETQEVDPRACCYSGGQNIFHLAALRGQCLVCWWLCQNGFSDLATLPDSDGMSGVEMILKCPGGRCAALILNILMRHFPAVLPASWLELAEVSENEEIRKVADWVRTVQISKSLPSLITPEADLAILIEAVQTSSIADCQTWWSEHVDEDGGVARHLVMQVIEKGIQHKRFDFLRWVLLTKKEKWLAARPYSIESEKTSGLIEYCSKIACRESCVATQDFLLQVQAIYNVQAAIAGSFHEFHEKLLQVSPVEKLENLRLRHIELMAGCPNDVKMDEMYAGVGTLRYIASHGLDPLQWAFHFGHLEILAWALKVRYAREKLEQTANIFEDIKVSIGQQSWTHPAAVECLLAWMTRQGMSIVGGFDLDGTKYQNLLDALAECLGSSLVFESTADRISPMMDTLRYLSQIPALKASTTAGELRNTILMRFAKCTAYPVQERPEDAMETMAEQYLLAVQLLEEAGANIHCKSDGSESDDTKLTFTEFLVGQGEILTLPTIRWLAFERGVSVQFMISGHLKNSILKKKQNEKVFEVGFEKIRAEQALKFAEVLDQEANTNEEDL